MTGSTDSAGASDDGPRIPMVRRVAIGCFTAWLGMFSGAMVLVLVSKLVAYLTHAKACPGIPACNWYIYATVGGALGAVSLPVLVLWAMAKPVQRPTTD